MWRRSVFAGGLLALALFGGATAGPFEDAQAAYQHGDYAAALRLWRPLADQGNAYAQNSVGVMYESGQGVAQDSSQAVIWYRKAADMGYATAQINLGSMYDNGRGVPQDYAQAVMWYRKAADQGNALAQTSLGVMYVYGEGVPQDYVLAHMWFNLAAAHAKDAPTRDMAAKDRDLAAAKMTPDQIAEAQRMAREWVPK